MYVCMSVSSRIKLFQFNGTVKLKILFNLIVEYTYIHICYSTIGQCNCLFLTFYILHTYTHTHTHTHTHISVVYAVLQFYALLFLIT